MFAVTPPTCVQMGRVGSGAAAPSVRRDKRTSNFGSAAAAWIGTLWKGGVWAPVFTVSLRVGGVWLILWACVHVCAPGMCTVLELTDKVWKGEERRGLSIKRKRRCASLWVEGHVFGCLTKGQWQSHDIIDVKEWNMGLDQHSCFLSHSSQRPSGSFCWLGSQHNMFKHQKHTHHPPPLLWKKKKKTDEKTVTKLVSVNMWSQQLSWTFTSPWNAAEFFKVTIKVENLVHPAFEKKKKAKSEWTK